MIPSYLGCGKMQINGYFKWNLLCSRFTTEPDRSIATKSREDNFWNGYFMEKNMADFYDIFSLKYFLHFNGTGMWLLRTYCFIIRWKYAMGGYSCLTSTLLSFLDDIASKARLDVGQLQLVFSLCRVWFTLAFLHVQCNLHILLWFCIGISDL